MSKIRVVGVKEVNANLRKKSGEINKAAYEGLYSVAMRVLADAKRILKENNSNATGQLRDSGIVKKQADNSVDVIFRAEHASAVEFGRRAGSFPPAGDMQQGIMAWVMKKGIADTYTAAGNRRRRGEDFQRRLKSIAYLIARKIQKVGVKAKPYLYPAFRKNEEDIDKILKEAIKKVL